MVIEMEDQPPIALHPGSIAILPRNDMHMLSSRHGFRPPTSARSTGTPAVESIACRPDRGRESGNLVRIPRHGESSAHPLLDALPALLVLTVAEAEASWLDSSMRLIAEQNPPPEMVARLAELFLAQAIRDYVERLPPSTRGWLAGLADPAVSKALSIIHQPLCGRPRVEELCARGRRVAIGARRALHRADRRAADALLRAVADADRRQHAPRGQENTAGSLMRSGSTARRRSTAH